jgi:hypothetical protein
MGLISGTVLQGGGEVTGVVPSAMVRAGGEGNKGVSVPSVLDGKEDEVYVVLEEKGRENVCFVLVFRGFVIYFALCDVLQVNTVRPALSFYI